jgi:hypothetical protein
MRTLYGAYPWAGWNCLRNLTGRKLNGSRRLLKRSAVNLMFSWWLESAGHTWEPVSNRDAGAAEKLTKKETYFMLNIILNLWKRKR